MYEDILRFETRRGGAIPGIDRADVLQELRVVVLGCTPRITGNTGRTYVRRAVRNAIINMRRRAGNHLPLDARGRAYVPTQLDWHTGAMPVALGPSPEQAAETRELISALSVMSNEDRLLLYAAFVDGATSNGEQVEAARARAERLLTDITYRVDTLQRKGETMAKKETVTTVPDCHTQGADPIGYETALADAQDCQDCGDKATCLMDGLASGLIKADLGIDPEIKALAFGLVTPAALRKRLEIRAKMRASGRSELAPGVAYNDLPDLGLDALSNDGPTAVALAAEPVIETADDEKDEDMKPKNKKTKKTEFTKAVKKAAAAKPFKAPRVKADGDGSKFTGPKNRLGEKGYFKYPGKAKVRADGSVDLPNGRTVAGPGTLAPEQMQLALGKLNTKLGLPFDVEIGQTLSKQFKGTLPDGTEGPLEVKIVKDGFATNGSTYTSLSGAVQARLWRSVSGPDLFHFGKANNVSVRGPGVPDGRYSPLGTTAVAEKPAKAPKAEAKPAKPTKAPKAPKAEAKPKGKPAKAPKAAKAEPKPKAAKAKAEPKAKAKAKPAKAPKAKAKSKASKDTSTPALSDLLP